MKIITFIKNISAFLPWIAFGLLSSFSPALAISIVIIISLLSYSKLRKGFILEWGNLLFFVSAFISLQIFNNTWLLKNVSILMSCFFFSVVTISLLIKKPFTIQYAKLQTDEKLWSSPGFLHVNKIMTIVLGLIFLIVTLIGLYRRFHPGLINGWLVWVIALTVKLLFIRRFPKWYKKRHLRKLSKQGDLQ